MASRIGKIGEAEVRVLLVDDQRIISEALQRLLAGETDIGFKWEPHGQLALQTAFAWRPTVILQDLMMPDADGFDLVRQYRSNPEIADIPVVMLSTREEASAKAQGFAAGANDYLIKLPDRVELLARLRYHSAAYRHLCERNAAFRALRESERALAAANVRLQHLAEVDGLTGIANRRRFDEVLSSEWQRAQRNRRPLSLLLCDVDHFKLYNDEYGHAAGDRCLVKVAAALGHCLRRPADLCARYGGEEFALILPETDACGAQGIAEACCSAVQALALEHPRSIHGCVTLSVGTASVIPGPGSSLAQLVEAADCALYRAKDAGRNLATD